MPPFDPWDVKQIEAQAPDEASLPAARKVLRKGGFERIESRADGTGWWAVCQGLRDVYNVTATRGPTGTVQSSCTCISPKRPCKHALALLLHLAAHPELRPELAVAQAPKSDNLEGLIAAVFASPDDDLPRLVFADYLEERGEADRAAFIRLSCEMERKKLPAGRKEVLNSELARLTSTTLFEPLRLFPGHTTVELRRGFLWLSILGNQLPSTGAMPASLLRLFQDGWVESLDLTVFISHDVSLARYVRRLDLSQCAMADDVLVNLATDLRPGSDGVRLKEVVLAPGPRRRYKELLTGGGPPVSRLQDPTAAKVRELAADGRFRGVTSLVVVGGDDDAFAALADVPDLKSLVALELFNPAISSFGLTAVGNSNRLRGLGILEIDGGRLADADLQAVGDDASFPALRQLVLRRLHLTDAGLNSLATGPAFDRLTDLTLADLPVTTPGVGRLLNRRPHITDFRIDAIIPSPDRLRLALITPDVRGRRCFGELTVLRPDKRGNYELHLWDSADEFPIGLFSGLTEWPNGLRIDCLVVGSTPFADGAFAELLDFVALGRIRRLTVSKCGLRNADAVALANKLPELALTQINLEENKIGMNGAKALAGSPGLATVVSLDLRGNPILKSGRAALAASPHKTALTEINLGGEQVDKDEAKELRKQFGKGVKVTMWA
jgi:uncharacterized protein (TIGR02996 family)